MKIVCQQTIPMKFHALFVIFEKKKKKHSKIWNCRLLQSIGDALRDKTLSMLEANIVVCWRPL